jgi:hypothetical protein
VDHLVWGAPILEREIERLEALTGVRAAIGGRHPNEGTCNAVIRIGPAIYLELISPDPTLPSPPRPRWFGLDTLTRPRLITWAAKASDLEQRAARARAAGVALGEVRDGQRELSDGRMLSWRLTYPRVRLEAGLVPFLIDWGQGPHPAESAPRGVQLLGLRAEHPDPESVRGQLLALELELDVAAGAAPALIASLDTRRGRVELR